MDYFKNSFFFKLINRLEIAENSPVFRNFRAGFFSGFINKFLCFTQELFSAITKNSLLLAKIDYIILFLITTLIISLTYASAKTIGILAGVCFFALLLKLFLKKGEKASVNTFDIPIFLYIVLVIISVALSSMLIPSIKGVAKIMVYLCSYLVFFNVLKDNPSRGYYFIGIVAISAFAESITAIYQNFIGIESLATWQDKSNINPEQIMTRVYGTLKPYNPNLLAGYLTATISCAAGLFFLFVSKKQLRLSILSFFALLSIFLAIVFTGSRGAYLGTSAVLCIFMLISGHVIWHDFPQKTWLKKLWFYAMVAGVLAVLCLILTNPALQHRIASIFAFREDSSNSFRLNVYMASLKMFIDNWLTGIGPGNEVFRLTYGLYMKTGFDALGAYSVPLEIAVESGILALLAFLWLIISIFIKSVKTIIFGDNVELKILVSCCLAGIAGIMTHGLVDTIFFRPQVQMIFWLFIAILGANIGVSRQRCGF